jgi:hypothetical protein
MFLVAQHSQNEKFCYRVIVATQKLYELLPQEKAQSQQPRRNPWAIVSDRELIAVTPILAGNLDRAIHAIVMFDAVSDEICEYLE